MTGAPSATSTRGSTVRGVANPSGPIDAAPEPPGHATRGPLRRAPTPPTPTAPTRVRVTSPRNRDVRTRARPPRAPPAPPPAKAKRNADVTPVTAPP